VPPDTARQTRVYLLDDHDLVRRGLRDLLAAARDILVVGESASAESAARAIVALDTDVMLLDLHLPDGTGVGVCRQVRAVAPAVRGLLLTAAEDDDAVLAAIVAGAAGYATKLATNVDLVDLVGAVRSVASGRDLIDPTLRERVAERLLAKARTIRPSLADDEHQVLALVARGRTDVEIATELDLELTVVAHQVSDLVFRATGLATAPGVAVQQGLGRHRRGDSANGG
jgi:two-component system, NarL family, response regulator DevR